MNNQFLPERVSSDIERQIEKVLLDLGKPSPPLDLETVRNLLRLDRTYYSSTDTSLLTETVHRLRVGGAKILDGHGFLGKVIDKLKLKALFIPDRNTILIDRQLPSPKQRWAEAHEIGHSIVPWHSGMMHGDQLRTLSPDCHEKLEAEANFAAGKLLFMQDAFQERLLSEPVNFTRVMALAGLFGNTMTTTLWRTVETYDQPAFALISQHPLQIIDEGCDPVRYFVRSREFEHRFGQIRSDDLFNRVKSLCNGTSGMIGVGEIVVLNLRSEEYVFSVETFYNHHDALTLGIQKAASRKSVLVSQCKSL